MSEPKKPNKFEHLFSAFSFRVGEAVLSGNLKELRSPSGFVEKFVQAACDVSMIKCGTCSTVLVCENKELKCLNCKVSVALPRFGDLEKGPTEAPKPPSSESH